MLQDFSPIVLSIVVFTTQIIFLWLRTINIVYTSKLLILPTIFTGVGMGISWLITITIGVNALIDLQLLPIIGHLLGGVVGTYIGLIHERKKRSREILKKKKSKFVEKKDLPNYLF